MKKFYLLIGIMMLCVSNITVSMNFFKTELATISEKSLSTEFPLSNQKPKLETKQEFLVFPEPSEEFFEEVIVLSPEENEDYKEKIILEQAYIAELITEETRILQELNLKDAFEVAIVEANFRQIRNLITGTNTPELYCSVSNQAKTATNFVSKLRRNHSKKLTPESKDLLCYYGEITKDIFLDTKRTYESNPSSRNPSPLSSQKASPLIQKRN